MASLQILLTKLPEHTPVIPYALQPRPLGLPVVTQLSQHGSPVAPQTGQTGGDGAGGDGAGGSPPPPPPGHDAHQHDLFPFPHLLSLPTLEQSPPAVEPSTQIVAGRGLFLAQIYLSTISIGDGVGEDVGGCDGRGVGGEVGGTGARVGS